MIALEITWKIIKKNSSKTVIHTDMLSKEQVSNLTYLYNKFDESELKGWTSIDDFLELIENNLDDDQIYREAEVLYSYHKNQKVGCPYLHVDGSTCFVPCILEAVEAITELYQETGNLLKKHRYILGYYLALAQDQQIILLDP